jgi:hypothetical protein
VQLETRPELDHDITAAGENPAGASDGELRIIPVDEGGPSEQVNRSPEREFDGRAGRRPARQVHFDAFVHPVAGSVVVGPGLLARDGSRPADEGRDPEAAAGSAAADWPPCAPAVAGSSMVEAARPSRQRPKAAKTARDTIPMIS